jgi:hypothetical protein
MCPSAWYFQSVIGYTSVVYVLPGNIKYINREFLLTVVNTISWNKSWRYRIIKFLVVGLALQYLKENHIGGVMEVIVV